MEVYFRDAACVCLRGLNVCHSLERKGVDSRVDMNNNTDKTLDCGKKIYSHLFLFLCCHLSMVCMCVCVETLLIKSSAC